MIIDINKKYKTRAGLKVIIDLIHTGKNNSQYPVAGRVIEKTYGSTGGKHHSMTWTKEGKFRDTVSADGVMSHLDLIPDDEDCLREVDFSKKYKTRSGHKVILDPSLVNPNNNYPVGGFVCKENRTPKRESWTKNGKYCFTCEEPSDLDLVLDTDSEAPKTDLSLGEILDLAVKKAKENADKAVKKRKEDKENELKELAKTIATVSNFYRDIPPLGGQKQRFGADFETIVYELLLNFENYRKP